MRITAKGSHEDESETYMSARITDISEKRAGSESASLASLYEASLAISGERDETEREIKRLAESGFKEEAWKLLVKHLQIKEPRKR